MFDPNACVTHISLTQAAQRKAETIRMYQEQQAKTRREKEEETVRKQREVLLGHSSLLRRAMAAFRAMSTGCGPVHEPPLTRVCL